MLIEDSINSRRAQGFREMSEGGKNARLRPDRPGAFYFETSGSAAAVEGGSIGVDIAADPVAIANMDGSSANVSEDVDRAGTPPKAFLTDKEAVCLLLERNAGCRPSLSRHGYRSIKRLFDIVFSGIALIVLLVPSLILCLAICIDSPGASPVYAQHRVGRLRKDGSFRIFKMYKFRSMVPNAHAMVRQLQDKNEADGPLFKMKDDPRVTRIGKFIRRHSLDELPQFLNVFVGQMTLVGPRPPLPKEVIVYDERTMRRLTVKPGCGGIWQTTSRSESTFADMVEMDLEYIEKCSVMEDLRLMAHTAQVVVSGRGAY